MTRLITSEFELVDSRFIACDFPDTPSKNKVKSLNYDISNSPLVFYNLITYKIEDEQFRIENRFFVSEIKNLPSPEFYRSNYTDDCGKKTTVARKIYKDYSPEKFFFTYYVK